MVQTVGPRQAQPVRLPPTVPLPPFSRAGGTYTVDWARAHADAHAALAAIDFSRPDVVIWVPGTDGAGVMHDFARAAAYVYGEGTASVTHMGYEASWRLRTSLPTGLATLRLVLEGIEQRLEQLGARGKRRPRILLAGLSQGAWIIGEAMADPVASRVVTRAVLAGHPWLAQHQYLDGRDPRVRVINHPGDQITLPVGGDAGVGMDAMTAVRTGALWANLGIVAQALIANPLQGVLLLHGMLREKPAVRPYLRDAHEYGQDMARMVHYLRTGELDLTGEELDDIAKGRRPAPAAPAAARR